MRLDKFRTQGLGYPARIIINNAIVQKEVFWVVTPCGVVLGYQLYRGPCCFNLHLADGGSMDLRNVAIQPQIKTLPCIFTSVKTSNFAVLFLSILVHLQHMFIQY